MATLHLCHRIRATHPYRITRIHCKIYTLEELCYYLCNYLYLLDETIINEQLCRWLVDELAMDELGKRLLTDLRQGYSAEKFVVAILKESGIYPEPEMIQIQNRLEKLRRQNDYEREKQKGDNLLKSREYEEAILVYQTILEKKQNQTVGRHFYGQIYAGLGTAYGMLFLYQESAKMYDRAYQLLGDENLIRPYLYASYQYMSFEEYHILLTKGEHFLEINAKMRQDIEDLKEQQEDMPVNEAMLEEWKSALRKEE